MAVTKFGGRARLTQADDVAGDHPAGLGTQPGNDVRHFARFSDMVVIGITGHELAHVRRDPTGIGDRGIHDIGCHPHRPPFRRRPKGYS